MAADERPLSAGGVRLAARTGMATAAAGHFFALCLSRLDRPLCGRVHRVLLGLGMRNQFAVTPVDQVLTSAEAFEVPIRWIPRNPQWHNYIDLFNRLPFWTYLLNSVVIRPDAPASAVEDFGVDVFVVDTNVLLADACAVLASGRRSALLRAIDAGTGTAFMSEQAFHEVGRMSAVSARGHGVDHDALRTLIANDYLPRIPVVATPSDGDGHWVPRADDVSDPDDRPHVQVARLISARVVYSHDKDLRRPGLAPATRRDYDQRVLHLSVMSTHREHEQGAALAIGNSQLVSPTDEHRLEARIAKYLARCPDATMTAIREALALNAAESRRLSEVLQSHPSFERASRHGWAVGGHRSELETSPSQHWRPRGE